MCTFALRQPSHRDPVPLDEEEIESRARDGDVDALSRWADRTLPVDYNELGWAD